MGITKSEFIETRSQTLFQHLMKNQRVKTMFSHIPDPVLGDSKLTPNAKILFGIRYSFETNEMDFFANNDTLAKKLGVSEEAIRRLYNELERSGFIKILSKGRFWKTEINRAKLHSEECTVQNCTKSAPTVQNYTETVQNCTTTVQNCTSTHIYIKESYNRNLEGEKATPDQLLENFITELPELTEFERESVLLNNCDGNEEFLEYQLQQIKDYIKAHSKPITGSFFHYVASWIQRSKVRFNDTPAAFKKTVIKTNSRFEANIEKLKGSIFQ